MNGTINYLDAHYSVDTCLTNFLIIFTNCLLIKHHQKLKVDVVMQNYLMHYKYTSYIIKKIKIVRWY